MRKRRAVEAVEFEVIFEDGLWQAAGIHESIFTLGQTLDELWANICEATALHFDVPLNDLPSILLKLTTHAPASTARR